MKELSLTIKKQWFDMVGNGKPEEYRDITPFWCKRLLAKIPVPWGGYWSAQTEVLEKQTTTGFKTFTGGCDPFIQWDQVLFANGGHFGDVPKKRFKFNGIEIREGNPEWGATPGVKYFVIKLGERI